MASSLAPRTTSSLGAGVRVTLMNEKCRASRFMATLKGGGTTNGLRLAVRAESGGAAVDLVGLRERAGAARAGLAAAPVDRQPLGEAAALARGIAIVTEAGAASVDRLAQDAHDAITD